MTPLNFDAFLDLGFSDNLRHVLRVTADRDDLKALTAHRKDDKLTAQAWTRIPRRWPEDALGLWLKRPPLSGRSRTMRAVDLVLSEGLTVYAAAKRAKVHQSAVHRAIQRRSDKDLCPCCGQVLREGYSVRIPRSNSASS